MSLLLLFFFVLFDGTCIGLDRSSVVDSNAKINSDLSLICYYCYEI